MKEVERFEGAWQRYADGYVVGCSSGLASLHLAMIALKRYYKLPLGSAVAVPDYTMCATWRAVEMAGLVPIPIDCDSLGRFSAEAFLNHSAKPIIRAAVVTHIYGRLCNMVALRNAVGTSFPIIEDCAESHTAFHGLEAFSFARCWSFYQNKIIHSGGEGGAVSFRFRESAEEARSLRSYGNRKTDEGLPTYDHDPEGMNYRLGDYQASRICACIDDMSGILVRRQSIADLYDGIFPNDMKRPSRDANWIYDVTVQNAPEVYRQLGARLTVLRPGFVPLSMQSMRLASEFEKSNSSNAAEFFRSALYLPIDPCEPDSLIESRARLLLQYLGRAA